MIQITQEAIDRVEMVLSGIPKGAERVLSNAINRGLLRGKTRAVKKITEVYTISSSTFTSVTNTKISKSSTSNLSGFLSFSGYKIPLYKFHVTPREISKVIVSVEVEKGAKEELRHAFMRQMPRSRHMGVFQRVTKTRFPVEEIMGLSAAQMVWSEKVLEELETEVEQVVYERIEHEMDRLLSGCGGS